MGAAEVTLGEGGLPPQLDFAAGQIIGEEDPAGSGHPVEHPALRVGGQGENPLAGHRHAQVLHLELVPIESHLDQPAAAALGIGHGAGIERLAHPGESALQGALAGEPVGQVQHFFQLAALEAHRGQEGRQSLARAGAEDRPVAEHGQRGDRVAVDRQAQAVLGVLQRDLDRVGALGREIGVARRGRRHGEP